MDKGKGFTLIELLVVIAIIGILSGIVIVSIRTAPSKAKDARITTALTQVRSVAAEIYSDTSPSSYSQLCDASQTLNNSYSGSTAIADELSAIESDINNNLPTGGTLKCLASDTGYCVVASLNGGGYYCVDGTGRSGKYSSDGCDSTKYTCAAD